MQTAIRISPLRSPVRQAASRASRQAGLTLIEFMVSIVIGMIMIAALATLIANQSSNRTEIDRSGRMIENGRYAIQTLAEDLQMAGYWGELSTLASPPAAADPCTVTVHGAGSLEEAMPLHIQGYNNPSPLALSCVNNHKAGTDVVVIRRVDPDTSDVETAGVIDPTKAKAGQVYLQTGLTGFNFSYILEAANGTTDAATFNLKKKDGSPANLRKMLVHIYYISTCSVCSGGGDGIPTLKRVDLGVTANAQAMQPAITIAEGIENFQMDYGVDSDSDGAPNGSDVDGSTFAMADWANVVTVNLHVLARGLEKSIDFTDTKTYAMGTAGAASAAVADQGYKRHVFVQSVRLVNPAGRKAL